MNDPNISIVEMTAVELGPLLDELVLVGGCAVGLLITDAASPAVRQTADVDVIIEIAPANEYYAFCEKLKGRGFVENPAESVICRWSKGALILDVMPVDPNILGFSNIWYAAAIKSASPYELSNGLKINLISAPLFIATKIESFLARGKGDYLHHDIEDIINLVNGRESICDEIKNADNEVQTFLRDEIETLLGDPAFVSQIPWQLHPTDHEGRLEIVLSRLRTIAGM